MLKQIRENARIPLYILIVAFIGLYAVSGHDANPPAGKIFGRKVLLSEFQKAYNGARTQLIMRYGELPRHNNLESIIEDEAWNRLIMLYEAKKERLKISDKEIVDFVKGISAFFDKSGKFSKKQYEEILKYSFGLTPGDFEAQVRENLMMNKLIDKHGKDIELADAELLKEYKLRNEKAKADYVLFKTADYLPQVSAGEDEIRAYFEKNKYAFFKTPEQVNIEYIAKAFPDDKDETKQKVREEMKQISYEFAGGADMAAVAAKFSLEVKETGFFGRESNIPGIGYDLKFADAALALPAGRTSDPIETKTGIYIIKIKDRKPSHTAELADVKESVEKTLKAEKADAIAKVKAQEALNAIKAGLENKQNFEEIAKGLSLPVKKTDSFARNQNQYIEGLGAAQEFANAAFSAKEGGIFGEAVKVHDGYAIVKQDSIIPIDEKKYEEEKDKFKESIMAQKKYFASIAWLEELKKKANIENNLDKIRGRGK